MDRLLLEADPFGELALGQAARDARPDERDRELRDVGRFDERRVVQRVVLRQFGLEVAKRPSERVQLELAHLGLEALGECGSLQLADGVAYLVGSTAGDLVLPLVLDHQQTSAPQHNIVVVLMARFRVSVTPFVQSVDHGVIFCLAQWAIAWRLFVSRPGLVPAAVRCGN